MSDQTAVSREVWRKCTRRAERNLWHALAQALMPGILSTQQSRGVNSNSGDNVAGVCSPLVELGVGTRVFEPDLCAFEKPSKEIHSIGIIIVYRAAVSVAAVPIKQMRALDFEGNLLEGSVISTIRQGRRDFNENTDEALEARPLSLPDFLIDMSSKCARLSLLQIDNRGAKFVVLGRMMERDLIRLIGLTATKIHARRFRDLRVRFKALHAAVVHRYPTNKDSQEWI